MTLEQRKIADAAHAARRFSECEEEMSRHRLVAGGARWSVALGAGRPGLAPFPKLFRVTSGRIRWVDPPQYGEGDGPLLEEGDILGDLGAPTFGEFGKPGGVESSVALVTADPESVVHIASSDLSLRLLRDPAVFRHVRDRMRDRLGPDSDPVLKFLRHNLPRIFGPLKYWPEDQDPKIGHYRDGAHIFRLHEVPRGVFVVLDGAVRLSDDTGHKERVFALLKTGELFGEMERPIPPDQGQFLPTMLSAKAGLSGIEYSNATWYRETLVLEIPYPMLDALAADNEDMDLYDRLANHSRISFWAWWPRLMGASSMAVERMAAAELLRHVYQQWLAKLIHDGKLNVGGGKLPGDDIYLDESRAPFEVDWREVAIMATGGITSQNDYWLKKSIEGLAWLEKHGVVTFDFSELPQRALQSGQNLTDNPILQRYLRNWRGTWLSPMPVRVQVQNVPVLREWAFGLANAQQKAQAMAPTKFQIGRQWDNIADFWVRRVRMNGDSFRSHLLTPMIVRHLEAELGSLLGTRMLDAGCGEGYLCRHLGKLGARMTGVDISRRLIHEAQSHDDSVEMDFSQSDIATLPDSLGQFGALVCNMVLMDVPDFTEAISSCAARLAEGGIGVWTIIHPALADAESALWWLDTSNSDVNRLTVPGEHGLWARYLNLSEDAPVRTIYFHRNVEAYESAFAAANLDLVGTEMPVDLPEAVEVEFGDRLKAWRAAVSWEVPSPVICFVTRKREPEPGKAARKDWAVSGEAIPAN